MAQMYGKMYWDALFGGLIYIQRVVAPTQVAQPLVLVIPTVLKHSSDLQNVRVDTAPACGPYAPFHNDLHNAWNKRAFVSARQGAESLIGPQASCVKHLHSKGLSDIRTIIDNLIWIAWRNLTITSKAITYTILLAKLLGYLAAFQTH